MLEALSLYVTLAVNMTYLMVSCLYVTLAVVTLARERYMDDGGHGGRACGVDAPLKTMEPMHLVDGALACAMHLMEPVRIPMEPLMMLGDDGGCPWR